jgi:hypothetical protein
MPNLIVGLALLGFWLYCLFDVITTPEASIRNMPKLVWILTIVLLAVLGGLLWLLLGRPKASARGPIVIDELGTRQWPPKPSAPRGPDDDPEFLRSLERRLRDED